MEIFKIVGVGFVTAISAIVKKQASMSVGNVIGANVIDTTLIISVCSFIYGGNLPVSAQNIYGRGKRTCKNPFKNRGDRLPYGICGGGFRGFRLAERCR